MRWRLFADEPGARLELEEALTRSPQLAYAHAAIARIELSGDHGDPAAAVPRLERAIAALPESPRLHYDLGACHARLEAADAARAAFRNAMNASPLARPSGAGGQHLADEFHGDPAAIAERVMRFYADMMM
jgi:Flp pilus assembly protein TadD